MEAFAPGLTLPVEFQSPCSTRSLLCYCCASFLH